MKKYARQPVLTFKRGEPTDPTIDNSGRMQRKSKAKTTFSGVLELREPSLLGRSHRYADAGVPLHSVEPSWETKSTVWHQWTLKTPPKNANSFLVEQTTGAC